MAVPESMLNAIRTSAPTAKNPLGKLEDAPFSGDDGAGFATVMREVAPPSPSRTAEVKASEDPGAGNELPDLPGRRARFIGANRLPASDATLEEFAVEMGIDRSLARLLLTDTANDAVAEDLSLTDKPESAELAKSADPLEDATAPAPPPWFIMAAAEQPVAPMPSGTGAIEASIDAAESTLERAAVPLADEDLLLWRASVGRAEMATNSSPQAKGVTVETPAPMLPPAILPGAVATSMPSASPSMTTPTLPAERLSTDLALQGARMLASMTEGSATVIGTDDVVSGETDRLVAPLALEPAAAKTKTGREIRSIHELMLRRAPNGEEGGSAVARVDISLPASAGERVAATSAAVAMASLATAPTPSNLAMAGSTDSASSAVNAAVSVSAEGAGQGQSLAGQGSMSSGAQIDRVLSAPDPKLSFGERVQAFADAVAQRVLGQIRNENWSVSLQLDPGNLGAMDIDLTLRGNAVAANVGVANPEVRALLEAGLPRLKESLEASGLQLAGWSFGQSGSRGFSEASSTPFARTSYRSRGEAPDANAELTAVAALRRNDSANSAVDLFV